MNKWNHVISQIDNWIWLMLAVLIYIVGKYLEIPEMYALAGACVVKIKGENGAIPEKPADSIDSALIVQ